MTYIIAVLGFVLLSAALWDAFEVIISPRRVTRPFRFTRGFYRSSWWLWSAVGRWIANENQRETYLGIFGPLSLVMLLGAWATAIVVGRSSFPWFKETFHRHLADSLVRKATGITIWVVEQPSARL